MRALLAKETVALRCRAVFVLVECGGQGLDPLRSTKNAHRLNDLPSPNFVLVQCGGQKLEPPLLRQ